MNLAMAGQLVLDCCDKFVEMWGTGLTASWTKMVTKAKSFASRHGISEIEIVERSRAKPLFAGEEARDECITGEERLRVTMFIPVLDQLTIQLQERFGGKQIALMNEMS